jgi:hypothetical protein
MQLKKDSSTDVVDAITAIEHQGDRCFDNLRLLSFPHGIASWATLVHLVALTEHHRATHGYANYDVALVNLSRRGALILRWIREKGMAAKGDVCDYEIRRDLAEAVAEARVVAENYLVFLSTFPMWHRERQLAELTSPSQVRFAVPGGAPARRVSAFHKGFKAVPITITNEGLVLNPDQRRAMDLTISRCFHAGPSKMAYPEPIELYELLFPAYIDRLTALFRRSNEIDLGPYTVAELKRGFAALTTVFSVHEHLCFTFGLRERYPINSCVMVRKTADWAQLVSRICGLNVDKSAAIVKDLTLDDRFWDLHVQPFVPLDNNILAVAPQFPLHSRADENILRVCGHIRPSYFDESALLKEREMAEDLLPKCPIRYFPQTNIALPAPLPDIDLLLADEENKTILIAELKWLRKPFGWKEIVERGDDFKKGLRQLSKIRTFLEENPGYLVTNGKLPRSLIDYSQIGFVLVARDQFLWPDEHIVVDHEIFKEVVSRADNLKSVYDTLKRYEWLPLEGRDFVVKFEPAICNGVTVESEIFYRVVR